MNFTASNVTLAWVLWLLLLLLGQLAVLHIRFLWQTRRILGGLLSAGYILAFGLLGVSDLPVWVGLFQAILLLLMTLNVARLWMNRLHEVYLRQAVHLTLWWLYGISAAALALSEIVAQTNWVVSANIAVNSLLGVGLGLAILLVWRVKKALHRYIAAPIKPVVRQSELPTVTLAIPARNETHALQEMLALAIKSDYPKLEILVLDDCSQDATAEVIRSFARDGVRFVQGKTPASGWLGKNQAQATLAEEASGDILVFAGVDTHLAADSISQMVSCMIRKHIEVLSVLPYRRAFDKFPTFFEQLRNFWQLTLPITRHSVPISSPCWAIWTDSLRRMGGFKAYRQSIFPEVHFARRAHSKQAYRFFLSNGVFGVTTRKRLSSQFETATRTFYPMLKRRPVAVFGVTLVLGTFLLLPFLVLGWQLWHAQFTLATYLAALVVICLVGVHVAILRHTSPHGWWLGFINFPFLVILEILLYYWSMLQFEFGEVNWKGRNVCYPLVQALSPDDFRRQLAKQPRHAAKKALH